MPFQLLFVLQDFEAFRKTCPNLNTVDEWRQFHKLEKREQKWAEYEKQYDVMRKIAERKVNEKEWASMEKLKRELMPYREEALASKKTILAIRKDILGIEKVRLDMEKKEMVTFQSLIAMVDMATQRAAMMCMKVDPEKLLARTKELEEEAHDIESQEQAIAAEEQELAFQRLSL